MSKEKIYIFDTTLRDGAQTEGVNFSIDDKNKIAKALSSLGIDYLEGGWPGANSLDTTFFNNPPKLDNTILTAFGMTKKAGRSADRVSAHRDVGNRHLRLPDDHRWRHHALHPRQLPLPRDDVAPGAVQPRQPQARHHHRWRRLRHPA